MVVSAGYSFNLDGTSIYLTIAALFVAQATKTHLTLGQQLFILFVLMLNSKGAAAVTGGGFITLAATLSAVGYHPGGGITLLLGVDRFMSQMRTIVNLVGSKHQLNEATGEEFIALKLGLLDPLEIRISNPCLKAVEQTPMRSKAL